MILVTGAPGFVGDVAIGSQVDDYSSGSWSGSDYDAGSVSVFDGAVSGDQDLDDADVALGDLNVLSLGAVFAIFGGFYYWSGKMWGYQYKEWLGQLHFWVTFIGVNILFFPQHFLGLAGMPRRYVDYPDAYSYWNFVSSIGSYISFVGVLIFLVMLAEMFIARRRAAANPWGVGATTLEWTLPSPPPFHQFNELPKITGGHGH